jgi:hypothetical protein
MGYMITISITKEDAELFKLFREHQNMFKNLLDAGLTEVANGKLILNYNYLGELCDIEKQIHFKVVDK